MEFKQIEAFVNVIMYKSFSKAADASFLTQPTISTHISTLEKELGVTLIDRLGKESRPTKQGRAFYKYALNLLNTREKAIMAMGNLQGAMSGVVEMQASSIPGQFLLPPMMAKFKQQYSGVRFYLEQSDSEMVWNNISDGKGELGFTGEYKNNSLSYEFLCRDEAVLITPKNEKFLSLREQSEYISTEDFCNEAFIWREEGSATRTSFEDKVYKYKGSKLSAVATINSLEAIKQCVSGGLGVSIVSHLAVEGQEEKEDYLVFRFSDFHLDREFYMVYNRGITLSPMASRFKDFIMDSFLQKKN